MSKPLNAAETIVDAALDLAPAERAAYLNQACGNDATLRQMVEALLRAHGHAPAPRTPPTLRVQPPAAAEQPGDTIGSYKLLQRIGEGGCGVVYMAEQEEPVRRRVALKVIKLGMDTKQVIARFEAERQALALMDHPNIAKVLEAGASTTGRPYFVMELVKGIKITDYCDQNHLSTIERLALFTQVCQAIQHAHQKGIIHRDIKPSNILVTLHDGVPVPKVIDFGIAKATEQPLTERTVFTALGQFMGTPAYMSPEQAELSGLDIDTRSDIYALGVLLYELLTGKTPFEAKELLQAGLDEMRRRIHEEEPMRPSTRLSTMADADLTEVAERRKSEPAKLPRFIRGDLDWIVMKCLEKDRTRRYETANGLAMDIRRHLNSEPVAACPPSRVYRFQKMVRRNKLAVSAVTAVTATLLAGAGISSWMFLKEKQARQRAEAAERKSSVDATKSRQIAELLKALLKSAGPSVARGRDTALMREILDETAKHIGRDLAVQPEVEVELRLVLADTYEALALYEQMEAMARQARSVAQVQPAGDARLLATATSALAAAMFHEGKLDEAEALNLEALAEYRRLEVSEGPGLAATLGNLSLVLEKLGRLDQAEARCREGLAMNMKLHGKFSQETFSSLTYLTIVLAGERKAKEAEETQRQALEVGQKVWDSEHPDVLTGKNNLAAILQMQGRDAEAEGILRDLLPLYHQLYGEDYPDIAATLQNLGTCLCNQGKPEEAERFHRDALFMRQKISIPPDHPDVASAMGSFGVTLSMLGRNAEALRFLTNALAINRKYFGSTNLLVANSLQNLGRTLRKTGRLDDAEAACQEALRIRKQVLGDLDPNPDVANSLGDLAVVFQAKGRLGDAEKLCRASLDMEEELYDKEDIRIAVTLKNLGSILLLQQDCVDEAITQLRRCLAILEKKLPDSWQTFNARSLLGASLLKGQNYAEAKPLLLSGYEGLRHCLARSPEANSPLKESLQHLVELFEATRQPAEAAAWRSKLTEFENSGKPE